MTDDDRLAKVQQFLATLEQLPPLVGPVLRGCSEDSTVTRQGQTVVTKGLVSGSRMPSVATDQGRVERVYAILSRSGRDISAFSAKQGDREVVFLPGTLFQLVATRDIAAMTVHVVLERTPEELASPVDPALVERVIAAVTPSLSDKATLAAGPPPGIPAKFIGDLD